MSFDAGFSPEYKGIRVEIAVPVTDLDVPGVTVTPSDIFLDMRSANPTATYSVVLDTMPARPVFISPYGLGATITVSGQLMFTSANWNQPQTVTVTAEPPRAGLAAVSSAT